MEMIIGIGAVVFVVIVFGLLSQWEAGRRRRMLQDVTRPAVTPVRRYDLHGELLPPEETALAPVAYRRIPATPAPASYLVENRRAQHPATVESAFVVPVLQATATAVAATVAFGVAAWAFGWSGRAVAVVCALSLAGGWLWRLGWADRLLYAVETITHTDLDHDGAIGAPALTHLAAVQPESTRQDVARQVRQTANGERLAWLQAFTHRCYIVGCSESAQGIKPGDRAKYLEARELLLRLGLAAWRDEANKRLEWGMIADEATAITIIANHVTEL